MKLHQCIYYTLRMIERGSTQMSQVAMKEENMSNNTKKPLIPYWWKIVIAFTLGWMFMNVDKYFLNPLLDHIGLSYELNNTQLGLVNSMFFFTYTMAQIPAGLLGDKIGKKLILVVGYILMGIFTGASGIMAGFTGFLVARAFAGLFSATYYGPQFALAAEAIPSNRRAIGSAIINSGSALGVSLAFIVSSTLVLDWGWDWRIPFYIFGVLTVLVGLFIMSVVKENRQRKPKVSVSDNVVTMEQKKNVSIIALLKNRNLLVVFIMLFCSIYGFTVIVTWLPKYLQAERGFHGSEIGFISSLVPWASIPAALVVGYLYDKIGKKKPFVFILVPLAALSLWATVYVQSIPWMIVALIAYGFFGKVALDPVLLATVAENTPKESLSIAYSLYNFIGMLSSIIAPLVTGFLADQSGTMASGFYSAVIVLLIGGVVMIFVKETKKEKQSA